VKRDFCFQASGFPLAKKIAPKYLTFEFESHSFFVCLYINSTKMVTIKINERTKNGKTLLELAKKLSIENKSIIIQ
jgi:hypothetical protein